MILDPKPDPDQRQNLTTSGENHPVSMPTIFG